MVGSAVLVPPSQVGVSVKSFNTTGTTRTPDLDTIGEAILTGDMIVLHVQSRIAGDTTVTMPASQGWALIPGMERDVSGAYEGLYYKFWGQGDTDDTTPTVTIDVAGAGGTSGVYATVLRGVDLSDPFIGVILSAVAANNTMTSSVIVETIDDVTGSATFWAVSSTDDNTINGETRGTLLYGDANGNIGTTGAMAAVFEQSVDAHTVTVSLTQSVNGPDTYRFFTIVLRGMVAVIALFAASATMSTTGTAYARTNLTAWHQSPVICDHTERTGTLWQYAAWFDRSPALSRVKTAKRSSIDGGETWAAWTVYNGDAGLAADTSADAHFAISLAVSKSGCLHMWLRAHGVEADGYHWKGSGPGDIDYLFAEFVTSEPVALYSYPRAMALSDGTTCFVGRLGSAGNDAQQCLFEEKSDESGWYQITLALNDWPSGGDEESPYHNHFDVNLSTNDLLVAWNWAKSNVTKDYHDQMYFRARRTAENTWSYFKANGSSATLPADNDASYQAASVPLNTGINAHNGACFHNGNPVLCYFSATGGAGPGTTIYVARRSGGNWVQTAVCEAAAAWNLINADGGFEPGAPNSEYPYVSQPAILSDGSFMWVIFRSNDMDGSSGIPVFKYCKSTDAGATWSAPATLIDLPVGDAVFRWDTNAWLFHGKLFVLIELLDTATAQQWGFQSSGGETNLYVVRVNLS